MEMKRRKQTLALATLFTTGLTSLISQMQNNSNEVFATTNVVNVVIENSTSEDTYLANIIEKENTIKNDNLNKLQKELIKQAKTEVKAELNKQIEQSEIEEKILKKREQKIKKQNEKEIIVEKEKKVIEQIDIITKIKSNDEEQQTIIEAYKESSYYGAFEKELEQIQNDNTSDEILSTEEIHNTIQIQKPEFIENTSSCTYLGKFRVTAYCDCVICCGKWSGLGRTASGTIPTVNRTIAVDTSIIPFGSKIIINGQEYIAEDTGSAIIDKCIDIYMETHEEASDWGVKYLDVYLYNN